MVALDDDFPDQVRRWRCHQFAITEASGRPGTLLRKVADAIDALGPVTVLDVTYRAAGDPDFDEITATVYLTFDEEARAG